MIYEYDITQQKIVPMTESAEFFSTQSVATLLQPTTPLLQPKTPLLPPITTLSQPITPLFQPITPLLPSKHQPREQLNKKKQEYDVKKKSLDQQLLQYVKQKKADEELEKINQSTLQRDKNKPISQNIDSSCNNKPEVLDEIFRILQDISSKVNLLDEKFDKTLNKDNALKITLPQLPINSEEDFNNFEQILKSDFKTRDLFVS